MGSGRAVTFVLEDRQGSAVSARTGVTSAVAQAVVEEMLIILITIVLTSIIVSNAAKSNQ